MMQDFWKVEEIAECMGWSVEKTRRRLEGMRVIERNPSEAKGRHYLVSRDKLRVCWPEMLDALHRRDAADSSETQ